MFIIWKFVMKCTHILLSISLSHSRTTAATAVAETLSSSEEHLYACRKKLWYTSSSLLMPDNLASLHRWFDIKQNTQKKIIEFFFHASFNLFVICSPIIRLSFLISLNSISSRGVKFVASLILVWHQLM